MPLFFPFCHRLIPFPGLYANDRTHIAVVELELIEHRNILFILCDSLYPFIALLTPQIGRRDKRTFPLLFLYFFFFPNTNNRRVNHLAPLNSYHPFSQFAAVIPAGLNDAWPDMDGGDKLFGFRLSQAVKGRLRIPVFLFIAVSHTALDTIEQ